MFDHQEKDENITPIRSNAKYIYNTLNWFRNYLGNKASLFASPTVENEIIWISHEIYFCDQYYCITFRFLIQRVRWYLVINNQRIEYIILLYNYHLRFI